MTCEWLSAVCREMREAEEVLVNPMDKYAHTMSIIRSIREKTDTAVMYYSAGGKDSLALLDMLAGVFDKVICYYMYLVKGLDHIQPYIDWAERKYKNVEVRYIKHYQRDYMERSGFFCAPDDTIKPRKVGDVEEMVRQETGIMYAFSGMKGVDGYMKRMRLKMFAKTGYVTEKGMVYPLALWTNAEVLRYIKMRNIIKPFVYTPDTICQGFLIDQPTLLMLRERYPRDYVKVLQEFPFAEKLIYDYEREQNQTV